MGNQRQFYEDVYQDTTAYVPVDTLKRSVRFQRLRDLVNADHFRRSLVVGCGIGDELRIVRSREIVAFDLSWAAVSRAERRFPCARFAQASAIELPFVSKAFDLVVCSEVIEHIPRPRQAIVEFHRVLDRDGVLLISTPNWMSWWGAARAIGQAVLRRPITSGGQPIDNWFTSRRLARLLAGYFDVDRKLGSWYFPPTGWRSRRLPDGLMVPLLTSLLPVEHLLSRLTPQLGHLHVWRARRARGDQYE